MSYKINTTNQPAGSPLVEVDEAEFIDLTRMGLVRWDAGDIDDKGNLKKAAAKEAPAAVLAAVTGSISTPGAQAFTSNQGS